MAVLSGNLLSILPSSIYSYHLAYKYVQKYKPAYHVVIRA